MSLRVIKPGLLTSIQDLGRKGFKQHGVIVSGTMDAYSLKELPICWLAMKKEKRPLEITLMGPTIKVEKNCLISITGWKFINVLDNKTVPM